MPKARTTVTLDEDVFRAVKIKAARTGQRDSQVIEESLRRDLGIDDLAEIWAKVTPASEDEGFQLAGGAAALRARRRLRPGPLGPTSTSTASPPIWTFCAAMPRWRITLKPHRLSAARIPMTTTSSP